MRVEIEREVEGGWDGESPGAGAAGLEATDRTFAEAWMQLGGEILSFREEVRELPITPRATPEAMRRAVEEVAGLEEGMPLPELVEAMTGLLRTGVVHVTSPRYFGLFNPSVLEGGILGDALAALYNLQLAAWSHAPAACELEGRALELFREALGLPERSHANFTQGGAEANLSAALAALAHRFPEWTAGGVRALPGIPALYLSDESHHSFVKVARMTGLGMESLREVPVTPRFTMDPEALEARIREDREAGFLPLLVVGTAGTTSTGAVDPLPELARVAREAGAWFHVDAAWGGFAVLSPRLRGAVRGIEEADSVTWDAHKGLSVPMGAGMFFCRHPEAVLKAFALQASYMPPAADGGGVDPWLSTAQWSRRSIGLKVFMALAQVGRQGYGRMVEHQAEMADLLRRRLLQEGWQVANDTPLPVVCATHPDLGRDPCLPGVVVREVQRRGRAWISEVRPGRRDPLVRACITSYRTEEADVEVLVAELEEGRRAVLGGDRLGGDGEAAPPPRSRERGEGARRGKPR